MVAALVSVVECDWTPASSCLPYVPCFFSDHDTLETENILVHFPVFSSSCCVSHCFFVSPHVVRRRGGVHDTVACLKRSRLKVTCTAGVIFIPFFEREPLQARE